MDFISWLQILLIAFKLLGIITWSWWWVLAPFICVYLIPLILIGGFLVMFITIGTIAIIFDI